MAHLYRCDLCRAENGARLEYGLCVGELKSMYLRFMPTTEIPIPQPAVCGVNRVELCNICYAAISKRWEHILEFALTERNNFWEANP